MDLNAILLAGKWAFIGLIYLILLLVVVAVRREIASHNPQRQPARDFAPGWLRVLNSGGDKRIRQGSRIPLASTTTLGAGVENSLVLADPYISRIHARLTWDGSAWWIEDLGSANGTRLDGNLCPPHIPYQAIPGARLTLGDMVFELQV